MLRWLAPSAVAASGGALAGGVVEGFGMSSALGGAAAAGFVAVVALPILFAASVLVRALWVAWRPDELGLVEDTGSAPRLAAWVTVLWLAMFALAWAMFQGTWLLASITAFKPLPMSFAEPLLAVAVAVLLVALSRPSARALTALYRKVDTRWRRRMAWSPVRPLPIVISALLKTLVAGYLIWRLLVRPRIGPVDVSLMQVPLATLAGALAVHAVLHLVWTRRGPRAVLARRIAGGLVVGGALAAVTFALFAWQSRPGLTLAIWGERPLAGVAIDKLLDIDAIRARMSLAEFRPTARPDSDHPDIVLVTIDTVRADRTPPYGGHAEMPLLRELGVRGAVFEWAFSPSNVTRRSIPSMVTGLLPNRVRGRVVGWALRIDPRHVVVAERLLAGGYETAGFVCCYGFWGADFRTGLQRGLQTLVIEPNGHQLAKQARAWLDAREHQRAKQGDKKPLFLWMHILEPHNWQSGTGVPTSDEERRRFYDRSLTASDSMLVELLGAFSARTPEQAPIVIVTADHGEGLGDHGQPYHSTDLYNSQIRVPLVVAGPGIKPARITETVSLTDLTPTLLELAGFVPPASTMDGRSLADLATGRRASTPDGGVAFAAMIKDRSNPGGVTAIVRGGWKLIKAGDGLELYNVHQDPHEMSNVATARPQIVDELRQLLRELEDRSNRSPFE
jgi:hypothetical protein